MSINSEKYEQMYKNESPKSPIFKNCFLAFIFGGLICIIGQAFFDFYTSVGCEKKDAQAWASITLIGIGAFLTALKIYDNIAKHAGAGTIVPITGFANSIVAPAMEFKKEGHVLGAGAKMFTIAGPVLVFGIIASIICGLIFWIIKILA
ncbi:MAG: stage V sporulation protein AC [Oscillospiraceae bacterium]|jgi:stage V sporulation protein AC|nr:stage V sporulation protein AC [Oscillospiraceae bacterium]